MIFERRAYTLRPGNMEAFWDAQRKWNTADTFAIVRDQNLSYFSTLAGPTDQVVHLYRFNSLEHWQACYDQDYRTHAPEYFKHARPLMLRQETGFFGAAPVPELCEPLTGETPRLPASFKTPASGNATDIRVVETILDFFPGGLPVYWDAYREVLAASGELARRNLIGVLVSQVGRIHRVLHYRCFATTAEGEAHEAVLAADPHWRKFVASYQGLVAEAQTMVLKPSPLAIQRSLFEVKP